MLEIVSSRYFHDPAPLTNLGRPQLEVHPRLKCVNLRWAYCLTIIGCNFVSNDLLHQTLISYNGPWFTFPFMHI